MKNTTKIIISSSLLLAIILIANFALAEDDNEDNYRITPVVIPKEPVVLPVPVVQPVPVVAPAAVTPSAAVTQIQPIETTKTITQVSETSNLVDSDGDGIIDSLDKHPGEDDFAFNVADTNKNGVIDELEYLLNR